MRPAYEIEGYDVFALMVKVGDNPVELWSIYSNAKACQDRGEEIVKGFESAGVEARYCCRSYTVKSGE